MKYNCPACGAEVPFRSSVSVFAVCSYCRSMVVRHDMKLETLGKMAELPADMSLLQLGTRGRFENAAFELLGRLKIRWSDGTWDEWFASFDDGRAGWLADAQGTYAFSFPERIPGRPPPAETLRAGGTVDLGGNLRFRVADIKEATCAGSEGELPFPSPKGRRSTSVDLGGEGETFATLDYADDGVRLYVGRYVDFDSLSLTHLREIDGW